MLNHIDIAGRLTADVNLRYTQQNIAVASFSLAVERDRKNEDGTRPVDFIDCVAWRQTAEFVARYFQKGDMVIVSGRLQMRDWTDSTGGKRRSFEVLTDGVYFSGEKRRDSATGNTGYQEPVLRETDEYDEEDLPF